MPIPPLEHDSFLSEFHRILMASSTIWLNMLDKEARVIMWNRGAEKISGYTAQEVLGSQTIWERLYPEPMYRETIFSEVMAIIEQGHEVVDFETCIRCKDGSSRMLSWNSHDVKDSCGQVMGSLAIGRDVTELRNKNRKLEALAQHLERNNRRLYVLSALDGLTGLYNRRYMDRYLQEACKHHIARGQNLSLLYIDLDFFKQYNDTYGHDSGDRVLIRVAEIFKRHARRHSDRAIRFGGEEFALVLPGLALAEASKVAETIRLAVENMGIEHERSGVSPVITVSIGVSNVVPGHLGAVDTLRKIADIALYRAKKRGRNRIEAIQGMPDRACAV